MRSQITSPLTRWTPDMARLHDPGLQAWALAAGAIQVLPAGDLEAKLAERRPLRIKLGLDPTSPELHLGHLIVLSKLRQFQDAGHQVVLIIGDYTARIGDPSGRSKTRPALGETEIEAAAATYAEQAFTVLDRERTEIRRNSEWLTMQMPELFELARSTTLAQLLEREDFAARYRSHQPISMLEMLYPLIQGYDSVAVAADVELGGSDQTVNLLLARDIQRHFGVGEQVVLTMPLLVGIDGVAKMSKSLGNHIALTDSAEEAFAKTMSLPDTAMDSWFTLLFNSSPSSDLLPLFRKRLLARSVAELVAGSGASVEAEATWDRVHLARQAPADAPTVTLPAAGAVHLPALLAATFGGSRAQARRHLKEGGVRLDGVVLAKTGLDVAAESLRGHVLQLGKRRFAHLI